MIDAARNKEEIAGAKIEAFAVADLIAEAGNVVKHMVRIRVVVQIGAAAGTNFGDKHFDIIIGDRAPGIGFVVQRSDSGGEVLGVDNIGFVFGGVP